MENTKDNFEQAVEALTQKPAVEIKPVVEETPVAAAPAIPEPTVAKEDPAIAAKFAALARKEKELLQEREQFKKMQEKLAEIEAQDKLWQEDPFKALEAKGLDYEKLTHRILNGSAKEDKLSAVEKKLLELEQAQKAREEAEVKAKHQATIENFKNEISTYVEENNQKFELLHATNSKSLVYEVTEQWYQTHGEVLTIPEACEKVEQYLENSLVDKIVNLSKVKAKMGTKEPAAAPQQTAETKKETVTLTNDSSTSPRVSNVSTEQDAFDMAVKMLKRK